MKMKLTALFVVLVATLASRSVCTATIEQRNVLNNAPIQKIVITFPLKKVLFQEPRQSYAEEEEEEEYEDEEEEVEEELEQELLNAAGDDYNEAYDGGNNEDGDDDEVEDEENEEGRNLMLLFNQTENSFDNFYRQFLFWNATRHEYQSSQEQSVLWNLVNILNIYMSYYYF